MIQLFEAGIINSIKKNLQERHGIVMPFKYHPDLNILDEFRKNRFWNNNFDQTNKMIKDMLGENVANNMAVWNRTPVVKDDTVGNNLFGTQLVFVDNGEHTLRDMFFGKCTFSVSLFSTENKILYLLETAYAVDYTLSDIKIPLKYKIGDTIHEMIFSCQFNDIGSINFIDVDNMGGLRYINFDFTVKGLFFSPFYEVNDKIIKEVDLKVFALNKMLSIKEIENYNTNTLVCEEDCDVEDMHIIDSECNQ